MLKYPETLVATDRVIAGRSLRGFRVLSTQVLRYATNSQPKMTKVIGIEDAAGIGELSHEHTYLDSFADSGHELFALCRGIPTHLRQEQCVA